MPEVKTQKSGDGQKSRVAEIARIIGEAARARRVILFGSAARGEMGKHSDWDFLVVIPERCHRWKASHRAWGAVGDEHERPPLDIVVVREDEALKYRDRHYSVICQALNEGREVWNAGG